MQTKSNLPGGERKEGMMIRELAQIVFHQVRTNAGRLLDEGSRPPALGPIIGQSPSASLTPVQAEAEAWEKAEGEAERGLQEQTLALVVLFTQLAQRRVQAARAQERALELGWPPTSIEVIDEDQGRSGSSATARTGFRRLVSEVSLGQVGMVLMLEASRLARNSSDWHQLIELCGLSHTLLADESTVYDPRDPNDRLLLGVKGTLSEAELFTLRTRLHEGRWNKARKGLLQYPLPTGYVRASDGAWDLDPDQQVRERLAYVFEAFRRLGVARQVVRELKQHDLDLPTRVVSKGAYGTLIWKRPTLSAVVRILENPAYAGAYTYGRWEYRGDSRSPKTGKARARLRPRAQWPVLIQEHHPAYVSWEEYMQTQEQLRQNWLRDGSRGVARQGPALLQGIVWCGHCGRKMGVQHHAAKEKRSATYICQMGHQQDGEDTICQSMTARPVDAAVTQAFLEAVSPMGVEVAVRVRSQVEQQLQDLRRQWELQLEQARYEARLAQRKYDAV